jgi:hypothetical protein
MEQFIGAKFLSGRNSNIKAGIVGYSTGKTLEVIGNVGIGSTIFDPVADLDVRGSLKVRDTLTVDIFNLVYDNLVIGGNLSVAGIGTINTLRSSTGIVTSLSGTNLNYSGISTLGVTSTTNLTSQQLFVSGVSTFIGAITGTISTATKLQNARTFEITGDIVASPISFDGTGNVSLAATIQPNSVGLGTDTFGDYVKVISGTANQIDVTGGTGEGSTPVISFAPNPTIPGNVTIGNDLQVNNNLNVTGNITVGGTSGFILVENFKVSDADIILGFTTDSQGNDASTDTTANHGGIAVASTEGNPLVNLNIVGIETLPPTYKKIMWFKAGAFAGLNTDAWLSNYAIGIGSTQFPSGTRLAAGSVQFTENDLAVVRNINASGVVTASNFVGTLTGNVSSATYADIAGIATNVIGGIASVTQLNVSGVSTFSGITTHTESLFGTQASFTGVVTALSFTGDGSQLTGVTGTQVVSQPFTSTPVFPILASNSGVSSVGIATTGSNALVFIPSSGNLGIGTTIATSKLDVRGDVLVSGVITATQYFGDGSQLTGVTGVQIVTQDPISTPVFLTFANNAGVTSVGIATTGSTSLVFIPSTGNLGIGTTDPTSKLTVQGDVLVSGASTLGTVQISSGIVTASSGIVTYFGDGSNLQGIISGITIQDETIVVGLSVTTLNFTGATISVSNAVNGISTVTVTESGIATYASVAGIATYADNAGISTNVIGGIASVTQLFVSGISTLGTVQISSGIITATSGVVTYYGDGSKLTDILASSIVGVSSFATNAGIATNLKGGLVGNIPYQSATDTTVFLANGSSGTILQSNGVGNAPTWVSAAPAAAITGLTVRDEGTIVGSANSVSELNFVGAIVSATSSAGIATITFVDYVSNAGVATYASVAGIATFATNAGVATYASLAGIATYATNAGVSTYADIAGFSTFSGYSNVSGIATFAINAGIATFADIAGFSTFSGYSNVSGVATALQYSRTFEITGDIVASPISFDGTGNVSLAATIQPNSVGLGTDTTGDYVQSITGTANQISVSVTSGEGSAPTLSIPNQFTAPQDLTVIRDVQINRNLNVNGNITIGGTSATIFSQSLNIFDPDIILGFRTDAFGNDVSTDNTANHGGVAVASTEGTPLVQLFIDGIETNPATYKKIMWFKEGTFSGLGTDAWLINYAVGIGSTQFPSGTRLAAGSVQFTENDLAVVRNINASGVVTASNFVGTLTGNVSSATFATTAGIATNVIGGIASVTQLNVSGVSTLGIVTSSQLYVSGVVTASQYFGDGSQLTGVTGIQIVTQDPISTPVFLTFANNAGVTSLGVVTTGSNSLVFIPSTGNLGIGTTNPTSKLDVRGDVLVSGVSTLGTVQISSGIVTASSGIVTYFGDGQYLDLSNNPSTGIGIGTIGGLVGYGITFLNFTGASVSNTFYNSNTGIATIFFDGGTIGIGTEFPSSSINGELFFSAEFGRLFVYYDEAVVGVGTDAFWIDASPFNIGLLTIDDLSVSNLIVTNNTNLNNLIVGSVVSSGIVTAVDFNSTSDKKLKYNVETVENALDTVNSLRGVSFNWKENDRKSYGVIAQELEEFLPDLVSDGEIKTVNYNGIIGVLIEAVKELKKEIEYLKNL